VVGAIRRDEHDSLLDLYMRAIAEPAPVAEAAFLRPS
jgi:hypothetical protein